MIPHCDNFKKIRGNLFVSITNMSYELTDSFVAPTLE